MEPIRGIDLELSEVWASKLSEVGLMRGANMDGEEISRELERIQSRLGDIERRLTEAEEKPEEILQSIERIWESDPETG
jgi:DNA gyrase/topoisomerase IV subunit A